ncbi:hypothetical protein DRN69_00580 [Candidatus Pacearchaeota archaeon]|nr:MAG: hypothetical protein DRN69_00580 [Candidatus Pacearchaeota archaeon]
MSDIIKEEVERFKKVNGNNDINQRDLIIYLVSKVDKIDERVERVDKRVTDICSDFTKHLVSSCSLMANLKTTNYYIVVVLSAVIAALAYLFKIHIIS